MKRTRSRYLSVLAVLLPILLIVVAMVAGQAEGATTAATSAYSVPGSISGTVTDDSGQPLPNVLVSIFQSSSTSGPLFPIASTYTDASGNYYITGLSAGTYKVGFFPGSTCDPSGSCTTSNYVTEYYNDKLDLSSADPVTVTDASATTGINASLATGGTITGAVTDEYGQPLQNINVSAFKYDSNSGLWNWAGYAYTDASGNYQVKGLASGNYKVEFQGGNYITEYYKDKTDMYSADVVPVTQGNATTGIDQSLSVGGSITGTVTNEAGQPLPNIYVILNKLDSASGQWFQTAGTYTDASGNYSVGGLQAGDYKVDFLPYYANYISQYYNNKPDFGTADTVTVTQGVVTSGINAALATGGSITGTVTDESGQALQSIDVSVYRLDPTSNNWTFAGYAYTDASGNYSVIGLQTNSYKVSFSGADYFSEYYNDKPDLDSADPVAVTQGSATAGINAALTKGGSISGTVTDESGQPLQNISVYVAELDSATGNLSYAGSAITDASGNYSVGGLKTGTYKVSFSPAWCYGCSPSNYLPQYYNNKSDPSLADPVSVTQGGVTAGINAKLATGGSITGTVTDGSGQPIQNINVTVLKLDSSGQWINTTWVTTDTDADGKYSLVGLQTADYKVEFSGGNYLTEYFSDKPDLGSSDLVPVTAGAVTSGINASLTTAGSISGTVTDQSGQPLQNANVTIYRLDSASGQWISTTWAQTDASGNYLDGGLESGDYKVRFDPPGCYSGCLPSNYAPQYYNGKPDLGSADTVSVTAGSATTGINASLAAGGSISGTVTGGSGQPLQNISVGAYSLDSVSGQWYQVGSVNTDAGGHYSISGLQTGDYKVGFFTRCFFPGCTTSNFAPEYYNGKPDMGSADPVAVTAGSVTSGIDASLGAAGSISGNVTDNSAQPLQGVYVNVYQLDSVSGQWNWVGFAFTDASGNYTAGGLHAGEYKVGFSAGGGCGPLCTAGDNYGPEYFNDKPDIASADIVTVTPGNATTGINASLATGGSIGGRVTDQQGHPLKNVSVAVYLPSGTGYPVAWNTTDANGNYSASGLQTGNYKVEFGTPNSIYNLEYYNDKSDLNSADLVSVTLGGVTSGIDASLTANDADAPTVTIDSPTGTIGNTSPAIKASYSDGTGSGINMSSVKVTLDGNDITGACSVGISSVSCPTSGLSEGSHTVSVSVNDFVPNTGSASSSFSIARPALSLSMARPAYWGSYADFTNRLLSVDYNLGNRPGSTTASVAIVGITCTNGVISATPLPITLGDMNPGSSQLITLQYSVPVSVSAFRTTTYVMANNAFYYPGPYPMNADTTAPSISGTQPSGLTNSTAPTITADISDTQSGVDTGSVVVKLDGTALNGCTVTATHVSCPTTGLTEGSHEILVGAKDKAGNAGSASATFTVDTQSPVVNNIQPAGMINSSSASISAYYTDAGSGIDSASATVMVDGNALTGCTASTTFISCPATGLSDGSHSILVNVSDAAGNTGTASGAFMVDTVAPQVTGILPTGTVGTSATISTYYSDSGSGVNTSGVSVSLDGTSLSGCTATSTQVSCPATGLAAGSHTVSVNVEDNAGNSASLSGSFTVVVMTAQIGIDHTYRGDLVVTLGVGDTGSPVWSTVVSNREGGSQQNIYTTVDISGAASYLPPDAQNQWFLKVYDAAGGDVGQITSFSITYNGNTYTSTDAPIPINDYQTSISYIPSPAGSISGNVTNNDGSVLQGINVSVYHQQTPGNWSVLKSATADTSGNYVINGLPAGDYKVGFTDPAGNYVSEYYSDSGGLDSAMLVHLDADGAASSINAIMARILSGTVTDQATGTPLPGIQVALYYANPWCSGGWCYDTSIYTDGAGNFKISGMTAGDYRLCFSDPNNVYLPEYYNGKADLASADTVTLSTTTDNTGVNAALATGGTITGTLTDNAGQALPYITVYAYSQDAGGNWNQVRVATTDAAGHYSLTGLTTGSYKIGFFDFNSFSYVFEYYNDKPDLGSADTVPVTAGNTTGGIDAVLAKTLSGTVTDQATGTPLGNISVIVYENNLPSCSTCGWYQVASATTDSSGIYRVGGLSAGDYKIMFSDNSRLYVPQFYNGKPDLASADILTLSTSNDSNNINRNVVLNKETTPPVISNLQPSGTIKSTSTIIRADYTDADSGINAASVSVNLDGNLVTGCTLLSSSISCPVSVNGGVHNYTISVADIVGNIASMSGSFTSPALSMRVDVPNDLGPGTPGTITVHFTNTGSTDIQAPLLVLQGTAGSLLSLDPANSGRLVDATHQPPGFSSSVQFIASNSEPGMLKAGESGEVAVYYCGLLKPWDSSSNVNFSLSSFEADNSAAVDWRSLEDSMRPESINVDAWNPIWANFTANMGSTWGSYVARLDQDASYLGSLGENVIDAQDLLGFEIEQADGLSTSKQIESSTDASIPAPGLGVSFSRSFPTTISGRNELGPLGYGWTDSWQQSAATDAYGTVTIAGPGSARRNFYPDGSGGYTSQPGDYGTLTATGGGAYLLTETNGFKTSFAADGKLDYVEDTNGNRITAGYTNGNLTTLAHTSGQTMSIAYDANGRIISITDPDRGTTNFSYDTADEHLLSVTDYNGKTTSYVYATGQGAALEHALIEIDYPGGNHKYFSYDSQGRLSNTSLDGGQEQVTFTYGTGGEIDSTDASGAVSKTFLDYRGLAVKSIDPLGNVIDSSYDSNYNLTKLTDPAGKSYSYAYNGQGNMTTSTDPAGHNTSFAYGPLSRMTQLTDANGNQTSYAYDANGNTTSTTYADGASESWTYDAQGDPTSKTNGRGHTISYLYNANGRVTGKSYADGTSDTFSYDSRGNLISTTDPTGTTNLSYAQDQVSRIDFPGGKFLEFTYDAAGRRISSLDQLGHRLDYHYDAVGRLESMTDENSTEIVHYTYDSTGRISKKTVGNGGYTTYEYDADGHLLHLINYKSDNSVLSRFDYTYDSRGRRTSMATVDGNWTYEYDDLGQLTHAVFASTNASIPSQDLTYVYDAMGNRTQTIENGVTTNYATNNMNQYTTVGDTTYAYDADGNLVSETSPSGTTLYSYNDENKLIGISAPGVNSQFSYDANGNRVSATDNGEVTKYVVDPVGLGDVVGEYDGAGNLKNHYEYGVGLLSQTGSAGTSYYDFDGNGNASDMTNSTGAIVNKYVYDPFGKELQTAEGVSNPFQFDGQDGVKKEVNGLNYMRNRSYSSATGRFISEDPVGIRYQTNLYSYSGNNPVNRIDPLGLSFWNNVGSFFNHVGSWFNSHIEGLLHIFDDIFSLGDLILHGVPDPFMLFILPPGLQQHMQDCPNGRCEAYYQQGGTYAGQAPNYNEPALHPLPTFPTIPLPLNPSQTLYPKVDVVFVFDLTGSMSGIIGTAKAHAQDIMNQLSGSGLDVHYGVMSHMDYPNSYSSYGYSDSYGYGGDYAFELNQSITGDTAAAANAINNLQMGSGADGPEDYTRPFYESYSDSSVGWRFGAKRILVNFGDSIPHDDNLDEGISSGTWSTGGDPGRDGVMLTSDDLDLQTVLAAMAQNNITLLACQTDNAYATEWTYWAGITGGAVYNTSSVSMVDDVVNAVRSQMFNEAPTPAVFQTFSSGHSDQDVAPPANPE